MSHRLRLYFGSGCSDTGPVLEDQDESATQEDDRAAAFRRQPHPPPFRTLYFPGPPDCSLKRSSSMFIPQLTSAEPRPTMSSSMQISLQRSAAGPDRKSVV